MFYSSHIGLVCIYKKCEAVAASLSNRSEFVLAKVSSSWFVAISDNVWYFDRNNKYTHDLIINDELSILLIIGSSSTDWSARANQPITSQLTNKKLLYIYFCIIICIIPLLLHDSCVCVLR